ncbi:MAG: MBL fold metallo-hydrolase, partial [Planctomycetota bacterium]
RIPLATRTLLAIDRSTSRVILADTGCGTKWSPDAAKRFEIQHNPTAIADALMKLGLSANEVTDMIVTHLHFDHNGGLTEWEDEPEGPTRFVFPNATHWLHRHQWDHANLPHAKDRASYLKPDFDRLDGLNRLRFVEGDKPASPWDGMKWFLSHGHTPYQLLPLFDDGKNSLLFVGDLIPTVAHLRPTWVMAYDLEPMKTMNEKHFLLRRSLETGLILAFPHDPAHGAVRIEGTVDRPIVTESIEL